MTENNHTQIEWIPTSEELPDTEETLLLHIPDADEPVDTGFYGGEGYWLYLDGSDIEANVTHWMEMPEPPE